MTWRSGPCCSSATTAPLPGDVAAGILAIKDDGLVQEQDGGDDGHLRHRAAEPAPREQSLKPGLKAREELDGLPGRIEPLELAGSPSVWGTSSAAWPLSTGAGPPWTSWPAGSPFAAAGRTSPHQQWTSRSFAFRDRGGIIVVVDQARRSARPYHLSARREVRGRLDVFEPCEVGVIFHPELHACCRIDDFMPEHIGTSK